MSIYGFSQVFWLNLITLWTSLNTNPWLNSSFEFILCITYSVTLWKLAFRLFQFSFFLVKSVNHYEFQDIAHQLQENIIHHFLHYSFFYKIFIKLRSFFYPLKMIYWKVLQHCPTKLVIYIPLLIIWRLFILL